MAATRIIPRQPPPWNISWPDIGEGGCFSMQTVTNLSFADSAIALVARHRAEGQILTFDAGFRKVRGLHVFPRRQAV
jgi:hypothetical protein